MKTIPTTKQIYKLRRVRLRANSLDACLIQLSGSHGISSATARMSADANMIVATTNVTHNPIVLKKNVEDLFIHFFSYIFSFAYLGMTITSEHASSIHMMKTQKALDLKTSSRILLNYKINDPW